MLSRILILLTFISFLDIRALASTPETTHTVPLSCNRLTHDFKMKLGQISPTQARKIIISNNPSLKPELLEITKDQDLILRALGFGLDLQKISNESLIYNIDSLVFIAGGKDSRADELRIATLKTFAKLLSSSSSIDYFGRFQSTAGLRMVGTLALVNRSEEAFQILNYIRNGLDTGKINDSNYTGKILELRQLMSNTGRFSSQKDSEKFCELVKKL